MNYEYIEQLLERYWNAETTLEEEKILKSFFSQDNIPENFQKYTPVFSAQSNIKEQGLGEDFDNRILHNIGSSNKKHQVIPFIKAAAAVAIMLTIGNVTGRVAQNRSEGMGSAPADTYIKNEDISAQIKVIDARKSESISISQNIIPTDSIPLTSEAIDSAECRVQRSGLIKP